MKSIVDKLKIIVQDYLGTVWIEKETGRLYWCYSCDPSKEEIILFAMDEEPLPTHSYRATLQITKYLFIFIEDKEKVYDYKFCEERMKLYKEWNKTNEGVRTTEFHKAFPYTPKI